MNIAGSVMGKFDFNEKDKAAIASSGMDFSERARSASFLQQDNELCFSKSLQKGVEIMTMEEALEKVPEARKYYGKVLARLNKEYPENTSGGYFIRIKKGHTVEFPIQACLFLKRKGFKQRVHNLVIVEEGAKAYVITGCAASGSAKESFHLGVSEFLVKKGGYLNFTMIHSWKEDISVRPVSAALVRENASFISNYVCLKPVREIIMYPTAVLEGENARASFNSMILSHPGTLQDIGSRVLLKAKNTRAEIISRAVSLGGEVIARGDLKAEANNVKAHLECRGLVISEKGTIHAVPELETNYRDVDLSHEAAIGKIRKEEIEYLCSRGMTAEEAQSIIVRGFMNVGMLSLPEMLKNEMKNLEEKTLKESF